MKVRIRIERILVLEQTSFNTWKRLPFLINVGRNSCLFSWRETACRTISVQGGITLSVIRMASMLPRVVPTVSQRPIHLSFHRRRVSMGLKHMRPTCLIFAGLVLSGIPRCLSLRRDFQIPKNKPSSSVSSNPILSCGSILWTAITESYAGTYDEIRKLADKVCSSVQEVNISCRLVVLHSPWKAECRC